MTNAVVIFAVIAGHALLVRTIANLLRLIRVFDRPAPFAISVDAIRRQI